MSVAVLCGGVGAARLLAGLVRVVAPGDVTAVVNVADDVEVHGLAVSPDLDTVVYTLAGANDTERGWGLRDESWQAMATLGRYGTDTWFALGDRDLGTHLYRTRRLAEGASLSTVSAEVARAWGVDVTVLPATDGWLRTMLTLADGGGEVPFQEYFVRRRHDVAVSRVRYDGAARARPAPGVVEAVRAAATVVIAPSNPVLSIGPLLAIPALRAAVEGRRASVVAISPLVGGRALKGPADRLMRELGHGDSVVDVARLYAPVAGTLVVDDEDAGYADAVRAAGLRCVVTDTIMRDPGAAAALCTAALAR